MTEHINEMMSNDDAVFNGQCVKVGDIVTFGKYRQTTSKPDPLQWRVLEIDSANRKLLLLTEYVIDAKIFDRSHYGNYPTWAESDIRKWLNDTGTSGFLREDYFTVSEQALIVEVTNSTSNFKTFDDKFFAGGVDTQDKVFLLDRRDAMNTAYFADKEARKAKATLFIINNRTCKKQLETVFLPDGTKYFINPGPCIESFSANLNEQHFMFWWLRSPGRNMNSAAFVRNDGTIHHSSRWVNEFDMGIRPALWVKY